MTLINGLGRLRNGHSPCRWWWSVNSIFSSDELRTKCSFICRCDGNRWRNFGGHNDDWYRWRRRRHGSASTLHHHNIRFKAKPKRCVYSVIGHHDPAGTILHDWWWWWWRLGIERHPTTDAQPPGVAGSRAESEPVESGRAESTAR